MDEMVASYLPKAFAFIYVINSYNAGGVQKDRVSTTGTSARFKYGLAALTVVQSFY